MRRRSGYASRLLAGPTPRIRRFWRGALVVNGREVVGGIVVMRTGGNAMEVIQRVKGKTAAIAPSLPPGVTFKPFYDRSELIQRTLDTLKHALWEEIILVTPVIFTWLRERELKRAPVTPPPALL